MGTRHLISVYVDGEVKMAQYGQWDGYPAGQGSTVVAFLREVDLDAFVAQARKTRMVTPTALKALWVAAGADPDSDMVNMTVSDAFKEANPQLSRDSGAGTLPYIMLAEDPVVNVDSTSFAGDSLFCEYAYVIDLDSMTFEAYKGFINEPHSDGRFADLPYAPPAHRKDQPREYWPVRLVGSWPIRDIPEDWAEIVRPSRA